jgi:hypothetical protein
MKGATGLGSDDGPGVNASVLGDSRAPKNEERRWLGGGSMVVDGRRNFEPPTMSQAASPADPPRPLEHDPSLQRPAVVGSDVPAEPYPLYLRGPVQHGFGRGSKDLGCPTGAPSAHLLPLRISFSAFSVQLISPTTRSWPSATSSRRVCTLVTPLSGPARATSVFDTKILSQWS